MDICDVNDEAFQDALAQCYGRIPISAFVHNGVPNPALMDVFDDIAEEDNWFCRAVSNFDRYYSASRFNDRYVRTEYMLGVLWIASRPRQPQYRGHGSGWLHRLQDEVDTGVQAYIHGDHGGLLMDWDEYLAYMSALMLDGARGVGRDNTAGQAVIAHAQITKAEADMVSMPGRALLLSAHRPIFKLQHNGLEHF